MIGWSVEKAHGTVCAGCESIRRDWSIGGQGYMWRKRGIFKKYLFSYLCVLIPMLMLTLWQIDVMRADRAAEVRGQLSLRLEYVGERLDEQISSYREMAAILANEQELLRNRMLESVQKAKQGIERLEEIADFNSELREIFMVYGDGKVYGSNGMSRMEVYLFDVLQLNEEDAQRARAVVESEKATNLKLRAKGGNTWILSHFPTRSYRNNVCVSVNFVLAEDEFLHVMEQAMADNQICLSLAIKGEEPVLYSSADGTQLDVFPENWLCTSLDSAYFEMAVSFDESTLLASETVRWITWYAVVAAMMTVMIGLSVLLSRRHYRPIARIIRMTGSDSDLSQTASIQNEYEYIDGWIQRMLEESKHLSDQLVQEKRMVRRQSATVIFNGIMLTHQQILDRMDFSDVLLEEDWFAVMAVCVETPEQTEMLRRRTENLLTYENIGDGEKTMLVLFGLGNEDADEQKRRAFAQTLTDGMTLRIGISCAYDSLERIVQAWMEAEQALSEVEDFGLWKICHHTETEMIGRLAEQLMQAIHEKNEECALDVLRQMRSQTEGDARECARQAVVSAMAALAQEEPERENHFEGIQDVSPEDGWEAIRQLIERVCEGGNRSEVVAAAVAYIQEHFSENDLSLDTVAAHCQVSSAYLSRLFKRRIGIGYSNYVTEMRMTHAQKLLRETSLLVSEIAQSVGYLDGSSFRKKFKLAIGMSLSEYRNENRREV